MAGQATGSLPVWLNVWLISGANPTPAGQGVDLIQDLTGAQRSRLEKAALAGSPNFDAHELSFKVEFIEQGLRINQGNPPITLEADQQPWIRSVKVSDHGEEA